MKDHMISSAKFKEGSVSLVGHLGAAESPNDSVFMLSSLNLGKTLPSTNPD